MASMYELIVRIPDHSLDSLQDAHLSHEHNNTETDHWSLTMILQLFAPGAEYSDVLKVVLVLIVHSTGFVLWEVGARKLMPATPSLLPSISSATYM